MAKRTLYDPVTLMMAIGTGISAGTAIKSMQAPPENSGPSAKKMAEREKQGQMREQARVRAQIVQQQGRDDAIRAGIGVTKSTGPVGTTRTLMGG